MVEIAEFLRALNGALGLICIAFCVYFLACLLSGAMTNELRTKHCISYLGWCFVPLVFN